MDIKLIQELIKAIGKTKINEITVKDKGFEVTIKQGEIHTEAPQMMQPVQYIAPPTPAAVAPAPAAPAPPAAPQASATPPANTADQNEGNYLTIKSPMIGTFFRSPAPDKPPFVSVGDDISKGNVLCIIEAMKLFNEVESEISGRIVKVLVDDATPVEYDQPLFLVEPN